jgi:hypothetical protein
MFLHKVEGVARRSYHEESFLKVIALTMVGILAHVSWLAMNLFLCHVCSASASSFIQGATPKKPDLILILLLSRYSQGPYKA